MAVRGNCVGTVGSTVSAFGRSWAEAGTPARAAEADNNAINDFTSLSPRDFKLKQQKAGTHRCAPAPCNSFRVAERVQPRRHQAPATSARSTFTPGPIVEDSDSFF